MRVLLGSRESAFGGRVGFLRKSRFSAIFWERVRARGEDGALLIDDW